MKEGRTWFRFLTACLVMGTLALAGCGDDGSAGPAGPQGPQGDAGFIGDPGLPGDPAAALQSEGCGVCHFPGSTFAFDNFHAAGQRLEGANVEISGVSVDAAGNVSVTFDTVTDMAANAAAIRISLISLKTGPDGQQSWFRNYSRQALDVVNLTDNADDSFTYVIPAGANADPNLRGTIPVVVTPPTYRVHLEWDGSDTVKPVNRSFDFVPVFDGTLLAQAPAGTSKRTVSTDACLKCHEDKPKENVDHGISWGWYFGFVGNRHGDSRYSVENCNVCHDRYGFFTPATTADSEGTQVAGASVTAANAYNAATNPGGFTNNNSPLGFNMHRRHSRAGEVTTVVAGVTAVTTGNRYAGDTYPQDVRNCRTCHDLATAPEADNWKTKPSRLDCGGCHLEVNFQTGVGHPGAVGGADLPQADDALCAGCHNPASIELVHLTNTQTPSNPSAPAGLLNLTYEIAEVTVAGVNPVATFRILNAVSGLPIDLSSAGLTALGLTGSPSFLLAYAAPQGNVTAPADWNQIGRSAGQPESVRLTDALGATPVADANGFYTVTLNGTYPADATMRAVALQGYFSMTEAFVGRDLNDDLDLLDSVGRYTPSVIKGVTGDPVRRTIVDQAKCLGCHETLQLHGGNRVDNPQVCVVCHNPNLSTSGRGADLALTRTGGALTATNETIAAVGSNPLIYPEASNNLKDLVHGIHAATRRGIDFTFVRDRGTSGVFYFDWSHVGYPGNLTNCTKCHSDGFGVQDTPLNALVSTQVTDNGAIAAPTDVAAARASVPNGKDIVVQPISAACYGCHANVPLQGHLRSMGGGYTERRLVTGE